MSTKSTFSTQIADLETAVASFCGYVENLPPESKTNKLWGAKEVLAHLHFWLNSFVVQLEAIITGQTPHPPTGRFDEINDQVVAQNRNVPIDQLLNDYAGACGQLCQLASNLDPDDIRFCLKIGSKPKPLRWFITAETGHIRGHLRDLKYQSDQRYLKDVEKLAKTSTIFCQFIRALRPPISVDVKATLAQVVFWHERYIADIQTLLDGKTIDLPTRKPDELNSEAVEILHTLMTDDLLRRFEESDERLRHFGRTLDPQNIVIPMHWKNGFHWHTLDTIIKKVERDIAARLRQLKHNA